jgi:uncharacterized protein YutE (UPF0331/DUF86 family)
MIEEKREDRLKERINEKINELEKYLSEFQTIQIPSFQDYKLDFKIKAICERYFEKIIETIISLSLFVIRLKNFIPPEDEDNIFSILSKNNIISNDLSLRLKDAKDMRNIIIHNYLKVEDLMVYNSITEEIFKDANDFLEVIKAKI